MRRYDARRGGSDSDARDLGRACGPHRRRAPRQAAAFLAIQEKEAQWWRDASIAYFQSLNGLPLPPGFAAPARTLEHYKSLWAPDQRPLSLSGDGTPL